MVQIVLLTLNDDNYASRDIDVIVCPSKENAYGKILNRINEHFDGEWETLESAAKDLREDLGSSLWIEAENKFVWYDNGCGEEYYIAEINTDDVDGEVQHIGTSY